MRRKDFKFSVIVIILAVLAASSFAYADSGVLGVWRDLNPTAYISPPANPPLNSVYMLNSTSGWAVGDERYTTDNLHSFPAMLHYDGSTWNLVPVPKNPTEESDILAGYALTSVNFGPPGQPISSNDGWAVGCGFDNGKTAAALPPPTCIPASGILSSPMALHWDGVTWREQLNGFTAAAGPLQSVFMVSSTDVWAVGLDPTGATGEFWHWTGVAGLGGGWNPEGTAIAPLYSVFMVSPTEGWAVGGGPLAAKGGVIYHYFGGAWTMVPSPVSTPTATTLRSVFMVSPTEGWAVGDDGSGPPAIGVIIHYSGGTWTGPVSPGTAPSTLRSVFMASSTEGWAVGDFGTIVHYSGGAWAKLPINLIPTIPAYAFDFNSVFLNAANDAWSVGTAGSILHYDGVNWGTVTSPSLTELTSISFGPPPGVTSPGYTEYTPDPNDGWAVGRATSSLTPSPGTVNPVVEPTIIHWNGFMWTKGVAIGSTNDLLSVFMVNSGDVWAVGGGGTSGGQPTATCTTVPCPVILHFTGGSWNTVTPPPGQYVLTSIFMVNSNEGWAVGCIGNPSQCSPVPHSNPPRATGGKGIILHYTVTAGVGTWAIFPAPTQSSFSPTLLPPLNSVFMLSPDEGWAVGDSGTVLHYTVTGGIGTWNAVTVNGLSASGNLNSVFMASPTSGWAVGGIPTGTSPAGPIIIYWDGTHWTPVATPTIPGGPIASPPTLNSVYCSESTDQYGRPNDCWTVGEAFESGQFVSTIFHWDGVAWTHITLAPSLLGLDAALPTAPTLNSVYMITGSDGWIVGSSPIAIPPPNIPGASGITRVQGNARGTWSSGSTVSVTQGSAPAEGDLNVLTLGLTGTGTIVISSITQTGVTWTLQSKINTATRDVEIWAGVVGASASASITVTLSGTPTGAVANVCEYSGLLTSGFLDQTNTNTGTSGTATTGPVTTTQPFELLVGSIDAINTLSSSGASAPTNGFTFLDGVISNGVANAYLESIVSATGTYNTGATLTSSLWFGCIATFEASTVPPAPLSTILHYAPFGGVLTATATSTVVSTVTTSITAITSSTTITPVCPPNVTISIKAVDNQGNPVSGANVVVTPVAPCVPTGSQSGVTNSQGLVTFTLPTGVYAVSSSKNGVSATQSVTVSSSGQVFTIPLNISPGGLIPGFPIESIVAGILLGFGTLMILRRRRPAR